MPRYEYRILNKLLRYLRYIYICINKHGKAMSSISPSTFFLMHSDFPNKLTRKIHAEQCLASYSRWCTQHTHACLQLGLSAVQTFEPTSKTRANTLLVLLLRNVSYRAPYRDICIGIRIVSGTNVSLQA